MWIRLLTITSLFLSFTLLDCDLPSPPPGPENAYIALEFKNSSGDITKNNMTDTIGKQIKICMIHNLTQYIDSSILKITMGADFNDVYPIRSFKAQVDTIFYPVIFSVPGSYSVSFIGYIDGVADTLSGTIKILDRTQSNQNQKPLLTVLHVQKIGVGQELVFSVSAEDLDANQKVTISVTKKPENATFTSNQFKWTPAMTDTGTVTVIFSAVDDGTPVLSTTDSVTIIVSATPVNQAPRWTPNNIQRSTVPEILFSLDLSSYCSDPDNDNLSFSLMSDTLSRDTIISKTYSFTPSISDSGKHSIHIVATDPSGLIGTLTLELTVSNGTVDTKAPVFTRTSPAEDSTKVSSSGILVSVSCKDENGIDSVKCFMGTTSFNVVKSADSIYSATVTGLQSSGWNTVTFIARDGSSEKNPCTLLVHLKYDNTVPDNVPPVITVQSPSKDTIISVDSFEVKVTCVDDSGCSVKGYRDGTAFEMKKSASGQNLWTGKVMQLTAGNYSTIKIVATDSSKARNHDSVSVRIKYDNDTTGPLITLISPNKDSVTTSTSSYTMIVKVTDPSGVHSVNGASGATSYTGVKDTGSTWKINISTLENNKVTAVVLTATDSSLKSNKTIDTVYIKSMISNGYTITFDKNDSDATGTMAKQTINSGDSAALTKNAFVKDGWVFTGWATDSTAAVSYLDGASYKTGTSNVTLYAKWTRKTTFALNITADNGTVVKAPNAAVYDSGAVVTLTPAPDDNYHFSGWSGALTGSANPATIIMNSEKSITAGFEINPPNSFSLTVLAENGTVTKSPNATSYDSGTVVTLTATPAAGYQFTGWSGGLSVTTNPASITMNSVKSVTANFTIKTYALTITSTNGSVAKSPNEASYDSGTVVTLTATPAAGYQFAGWSGGLTDGTNPVTIAMNSAKSVTANFIIKTYALTITSTNGSVAKSPNATSYDSGTVVELTATPAAGYEFTEWSGGLTGTANPSSITMNGAKNVTANFAIKRYALTITSANGSVTKSPNAASYDSGTAVMLTATPAAGYQFTGWSGGLSGTTNPASITMNSVKSVIANFVIKTYALNITSTNGTVTKSPNATSYDSGTVVMLTATSAAGYQFTGWSGGLSGTTSPTSITMNSVKNVIANFAATTCRITYNSNNGTGTVPVDNNSYSIGDAAAIKPNSGALVSGSSSFAGWSTLNGTTYACGQAITVSGDLTLYAKYSTTDVMDNDGNLYHTVHIGAQVWMIENLRVTKYRDGSTIQKETNGDNWSNASTSMYCFYDNNTNAENMRKYGALYNWYAVSDSRLAPAGWAIPTKEDWTELEEYCLSQGYNWDGTTERVYVGMGVLRNLIGKSLAAKTDWALSDELGDVGNDMSSNNITGFNGLPGGYRNSDGTFSGRGESGFWWTASSSDETYGFGWDLSSQFPYSVLYSTPKVGGFSVRCLKK
ncbi:MAG TPA: FISUMP domain-containing protein [Chitinispirillaceae bacterium]|nr:FISUMP domain-containing protein [Chitinispirillaceae bacterium]